MANTNQTPRIHSVKYNFLMNAILRMSSFLFPIITFPYVSRVLHADGTGRAAFATSVIYYFTIFASLGIPTYGIRACARCRDDKEKLSRTVHELLMIGTALTVIAYALMATLVFAVPRLRAETALLFVSSATLILTNVGVEWFYQAIEQYDYITYRNLAFKAISIALIFIFVRDAKDLVIYAGIQVLGTVGSNILNLIRLRRYILIRPLGHYHPVRHLRPSLTFFMLTVAATVYTNLDAVMLGFMATDTELGYYNAAVKMKNILVSVVSALGTVLLPRAAYYIQQKKMAEYKRIIDASFRAVTLIALPLMAYCMLRATDIICFLAGDEYRPAASAMVAITPTILLIGLSNITGIQILVPLSKEKYTTWSTVLGAGVDVVLNAMLIPRYGALGAAIGTLVAETSVLLAQLFFLRRSEYIRQPLAAFGRMVLAVGCACAAVAVCGRFVVLQSSFLNVLWSGALFFGVYGGLLLVTKEPLVADVLKAVRHKKERNP